MSDAHEPDESPGASAQGGSGFDIEVECPACGNRFSVSRVRRGATEVCPVCRFKVLLPDGGAIEEPVVETADDEAEAPPAAAPRTARPVPTAGSGLCTVCTQDDVRFNRISIAPLVSEFTGRAEIETKLQLAQGRGVLAEDVPTAAALELVERLEALRVPAFAVDSGHVPEVERELPVIRLYDVTEDAIQFQTSPAPDIQTIPWSAVEAGFCTKEHVVTGGATELRVEESRTFGGASIMGAPGPTIRRRYTAQPRQTDPDIVCTLLVRGRSGYLYSVRFDEKEARYAYLGPRMAPSRAQNFTLMLGDVIAQCPHALFPASTRAVAQGSRTSVALIKQPQEYHRYTSWVLCCVARAWYGPPQEP